MKMLRVDDDVHQIITELAEAEDRGLTAYLNRHFRGMKRAKTAPEIPDYKQEYTAPDNPLTKTVGYASEKDVEKIKSGETTILSNKPTASKKIRLATPINLPPSTLRPEPKYCKAGHLLSPTGRCLQKGCKWN